MAGTGWVVTGSELEDVVARFDAANPEAVSYLQHHFKSFGVNQLLKRAGAASGEEVQIGAAVFEYFDDTAAETSSPTQTDAERAGRRYLEETRHGRPAPAPMRKKAWGRATPPSTQDDPPPGRLPRRGRPEPRTTGEERGAVLTSPHAAPSRRPRGRRQPRCAGRTPRRR